MQTSFRRVGTLACILLAFFLVVQPVSAQEEADPSSAPIGRFCPATINIEGINEETAKYLDQEQDAGRMNARQAAEYLARQNKFCVIQNIKNANKGSVSLNMIYEFDREVDPLDIYRKFQNNSKADAQELIKQGQPRSMFFEDGYFKELAKDGSVYTCYPFPKEIFMQYMEVQNIDFLNFNKVSSVLEPVTLDGCPTFNARFAFPNDRTYLTGIAVRNGPLAYEKDRGDGYGFGRSGSKNIASQLNLLKVDSVPALIGALIKILMGVLGTVALVIIIYGGVLWMTAAGNASREKEAMEIVFWAVLGVIIILSSYAIVNFIITNAF